MGTNVQLAWILGHVGVLGNEAAHRLAATAVSSDKVMTAPTWLRHRYKSVILGGLEQTQRAVRSSSEWTTGRRLKDIDSALPRKHVKILYDPLTRAEAQVLSQLRTGHSKLHGFLARVEVEDTDQCECGQGLEDTRHSLLNCTRYQSLRGDMFDAGGRRYGDLSYMLGGRSSYQNVDESNPDGPIEKWKPDLAMVRAIVKFALQTGRLSPQSPSSMRTQIAQRWGY